MREEHETMLTSWGSITMYNRIAGAESTASKLFAPYSLQSGPFAVISLTFCAIFVL